MTTVFIYGHRAPCSDAIRYVGQSKHPEKRFNQHLQEAKRGSPTRHAKWIRSLLKQGLEPVLVIIDYVSAGLWEPVEAAYIQYFREDCGFKLTNGTNGGDCGPSTKGKKFGPLSLEHRRKLSMAFRGKKKSPEHMEKLRQSHLGKKQTPEVKQKLSQALKGRPKPPRTPEHCANLSAAGKGKSPSNKGKSCPKKQRLQISKTLSGRTLTSEHRAAISAGLQKRYAKKS